MFLNLLRFLLLILVFDSTLSKTPIPSTNQNSLEDPSFDDINKKLEKHDLRSEKPTHPNGKSMEGNSNRKEIKKISEIEFQTVEDPTDNFLNLQPNSVLSNSERNEKADRESTKKGDFNMVEGFLCNTKTSTENRLVKDSLMYPCDKNPEDLLVNSHKASKKVILNDSIIEPDREEQNSKSKYGKSYTEKSLKYMNESFEETEEDLVENPYPSFSTEPEEKASGKYLSRKDLSGEESGLDSDEGPVSDGRILMKHHASRKRNNPKKKLESAAAHHDSKKKISRIDQLVINQQSKVVKTSVKSRGGSKKNYESGQKSDDPSMLNKEPKTIISSETTLSRKDVPSKHVDIAVVTAVKEHDSKEKDGHNFSVDNMKGNLSDDKGISHEKSGIKSKEPSNSSLAHNSGKDETDTSVPKDGNFPIKDSKDASHDEKNKLDKSIKHHSEVKLSRSERIPESDRGYSHMKSKIFNQDPWDLRHDLVSERGEADENYYNDGNFPREIRRDGSRDVSHPRKSKHEDEDPSMKHLSVHNEVKFSRIPEEDTGENSPKKSKMSNKDPLDLRLHYVSGKDDADINAHRDGHLPFVDSKDVSHAKKNKPSFHKVQLPDHEQITEDDEASSPTHLTDGHFPYVDSKGSEDVSHHKKHKPTKSTFHKDVQLPSNEHITEHDKANSPTHHRDGHFPFVDSEGSEHVSHAKKNKPIKSSFHKEHKGVQLPNNEQIPEDDKATSLTHHTDGHFPFVDSDGSEDVSHSKKNKPIKSSFHKGVQLPDHEQVPEDDKATSPTHLEPTQESLSESLKVLFFNQSLYQEIIHLVKTDRNVQAYVFNVLLLYIPVLICDVLLWLVIFKLLRHIHRQFVSNRLNSAPPSAKREAATKEDSTPNGEPDCLNLKKSAIVGDSKNSESNALSEGAWYPPK